MAIYANTFLTYGAVGNREDLADVIYNIAPEETPFMSSIGRSTATATLFEWQTDTLQAPAVNTQLEGDDMVSGSFTPVVPTVRVGNRCQISRKSAIVSGTQEVVEKAGRASEIAYQMTLRSKELKRDMEFAIIGNPSGAVAGSSTVPRQTASMLAWVKTNVDMGTGGVNPVWTSGAPPAARTDGTARPFTETILKHVLGMVWTSGGNPTMLLVGAGQKGVVSAFAGIATRMRDVASRSQAQIIGAADVYVGDFSTVSVVPDRFQRNSDAWVIDPKMASVAYLRPFQTTPLAQTGDAQKRLLLVEYGLKVNNEAAFGLAADLQ